jgi:hypothetical protein
VLSTAVAGVVVALTAVFMGLGLDRADKIASVVGALVGVIGLVFTGYTIRQSRTRHAISRPMVGSELGEMTLAVPTRSGSPIGLIITVTAAITSMVLLGALVMVEALVRSEDPPVGQPNPSATTGITLGAGSGSAQSAAPPPIPVLWQGEILLDDTPRDFDYEPPARGNTSTDLSSDGYLTGSIYNKFWGGGVVIWSARGDPGKRDCATRLTTHGVEEVSVGAKSRICLLTNEGRVVFIKIVRRNGDGFDARVTIWG